MDEKHQALVRDVEDACGVGHSYELLAPGETVNEGDFVVTRRGVPGCYVTQRAVVRTVERYGVEVAYEDDNVVVVPTLSVVARRRF